MKKRILLGFLFALVLSVICIFAVSAKSVVGYGDCGDNLVWTLDDEGTLEISGSGDMSYWVFSENVPWHSFRKNIKTIKIGSGVTNIGRCAFDSCTNLTAISIPEGIGSIGDYAFSYCIRLTDIDIPEGVRSIGSNAFYYCSRLVSIDIPKGVESIGHYTFCNCLNLKSITLPEGLYSIGNFAFYVCSSLEYMDIPESVAYIGECAFRSCTELDFINVHEDNAFFSNDVRGVLFNRDKSVLIQYPAGNYERTYVIPESVLTIGNYAFRHSKNLLSVVLHSGIKSVGSGAFYNCTGLVKIITYGMSNPFGYDRSVFSNCHGDFSIYGYSGSSIRNYASNNQIPFVPIAESNVIYSGQCGDNLTWQLHENGVLHISGYGDMWDFGFGEAPWMAYAVKINIRVIVIEVGVTSIGACAFSYLQTVYGITLPDSINTIGYSAFCGCSGIASFSVPRNATIIGESAFSGCTNLRYVTFNPGLVQIGDRAFENCCSLEYITLPNSLTNIGYYAFSDCTILESVTVNNRNLVFCDNVFYNCPSTLTLYGYSGSTTDAYAKKYGSKFVALYEEASIKHIYQESIQIAPTCTASGKKMKTCTVCGYVEYQTVPALGHSFSLSWVTDRQPTCTEKGSTSRHCSRCGEKTDAISIEAKGHSFGGWVTDVIPTLANDGLKSRSCTVCGYKETAAISKQEYDIENNPGYGTVNFRVVDAATLEPIGGITISCKDVTVATDENGKAYAVLPVGKQKFNVYGGSYLSRSLEYNIVSGVNNIPDIGISTRPLVDASFNHHEMTLDEIKATGIDITNPANHHVYNYELKMVYTPDVDYYKVNFYWNKDGKLVDIKPVPIPDPEIKPAPGSDIKPAPGLDIKPVPGSDIKPIIHRPQGSSPYIEYPSTSARPYPTFIYPVSERCYLVVHGQVKWLKEMYDIEMIVINNSNTDTIENSTAVLSLPEGLSLAEMVKGKEQSLEQKIEYIAEGETAVLSWCIKGDKKGSYNIDVSLEGTLMPFNEKFSYKYTTEKPIIVEAGSAMHMTFEVPGIVYYGKNCPVRVTLENVSDMPVYFMTHKINSVGQYKILSYSDGNSVKEEYGTAGGGSIYREIFNPGEKMIIELSTNILFDSDFIKERFFDTGASIDGLDTMIKAFEVYEKAAENISDLTDVFEKAMLNLPENSDAGALAKKAFASLISECSVINSNAVYLYSTVTGSEYYYIVKRLADTAENVTISENELVLCAEFINKTIADAKSKASEDYNSFDKVTSVIISTPVKFLLSEVVVTTLEGSTTEIPYTVRVIENTDVPLYFGTENIAVLAYSTLVEQLGEVDIPLVLKLTDTPDSPEGYKDVIEYLRAVKEDIRRFAAKSTTGKTSFKAWIEDADGKIIQSDAEWESTTSVKARSTESTFTLLCSNPTAKVENGIMTFEGAGYIDVIPHTNEGATLVIEMTENGETKTDKYQIDVVEEHECASYKWETLIPADNGVGYRAQLCSECDSITKIESFSANVFLDVPTDSWYHSAVQYVVTNGIMNGVSETEFSPENGLTRAMFITVLHRLTGSPAGEAHAFTDVQSDSWYNSAVEWASSSGIINGVSEGIFAPDNQITREQMATVVYRYAKYKNYDMKGAQSVEYRDAENIALYANEAVLWCSEKGIMNGNADGTFMPGDSSTRSQAATVFMRLLTVFDK